MRTANNLALLQPFFRDRAEYAQRLHALTRVEDVVDDALEVVRVVGVGHHLGGVGGRQLERVDELLLVVAVAQHLQQALCIPNILKYNNWNLCVISRQLFHLQVRMVCWHSAILDELNDTRLWQGVEVGAEQKLDRFRTSLLMTRSEAVTKVLHYLPQLLH